jgi:hypothetical protein
MRNTDTRKGEISSSPPASPVVSSGQEVQAQIARLPFVAHGLLAFEYTEVIALAAAGWNRVVL